MTSHELTAAVLRAFTPSDERSARAQTLTSALLANTTDPFSRDAQDHHITGSAIVFSTAGVLLHLHKKIGIWVGPGGHVDPGESAADAAVRETWEETGIPALHPGGAPTLVDVDVHPAGGHVHYDLRFLLVADPVKPSPPPGESQDVRWFGDDEGLAMTDASFRAALICAFEMRADLLG